MRPRKLVMENIGPFTGTTVIDFDALGEIFLICGKTGSGKTTIFDALTYALYGRIPGARSGQMRMLRSHFVSEKEEASVTLDFQLRGRQYRVTRTPPALYTSGRGTLRETPEAAVLYRLRIPDGQQSAGTDWEQLCAGKRETDEQLISLIGLLPEEFSRIVLLPQGEFAQFLRQSSNDRRQSLAKLFPVELYGAVTERALAKQAEYRQRLEETERQIQNLAAEFDADTFPAESARLRSSLDESRAAQEELRRRMMELNVQHESLKAAVQRITERKNIERSLAALEASSAEMDELGTKLEHAEAADTLMHLIAAKRAAADRAAGAAEQLRQCGEEKTETLSELDILNTQEKEISRRREENRQLEFRLKDIAQAAQLETELLQKNSAAEKTKASYDTLKAELEHARKEIKPHEDILSETAQTGAAVSLLAENDRRAADALQKAKEIKNIADTYDELRRRTADAAEALENRQKELDESEKTLLIATQELERLEQEKEDQRKDEAAAMLAGQLTDGVPCPVCGATSHPAPARPSGQREFSTDEKAAAQKRLTEAARSEAEKLRIEVSTIKTRVDSYQTAERDMQEQYAAAAPEQLSGYGGIPSPEQAADILAGAAAERENAKRALDDANRSINRRQQAEQAKAAAETRMNSIQEELAEIRERMSAEKAEKKQLQKQLEQALAGTQTYLPASSGDSAPAPDRNSAPELMRAAENRIKENSAFIEDYETRRRETVSLLAALEGRQKELEKNRAAAELEEKEAVQALAAALERSVFTDEADAEQSWMDGEQKDSARKRLSGWKEETARLRTLKARLDAESDTGGPGSSEEETEARTETVRAELEKISTAADEETEKMAETAGRLEQLNERRRRWDELEKQREALSEEGKTYIRLAGDLSGSNPKKLTFEAWILGAYLEEITLYASRRLERISDGRYRLLLNSEKTGGRQKYAGLDLEIFDAYTGRKRPCETLSGGETFMASISLALALTDAVQNRSGGIQLDAVFIDEGFGSLDEATLEKALSILDEIRGTRMVGLISHVSELKNRIPVRLEVTKTSSGSSVSVHS